MNKNSIFKHIFTQRDVMTIVEQYTDTLNWGQRVGELLVVIAVLLMAGFFILHQSRDTGFFTARFGTLEKFLLYGPILFRISFSLVKVLTGRHNPARPFEAATGLLLAVAAVWFLIVFPFDFGHLADVLPRGLRFAVAWVSNGIGKIVLILQVIAGPIIAISAMRAYFGG